MDALERLGKGGKRRSKESGKGREGTITADKNAVAEFNISFIKTQKKAQNLIGPSCVVE